MKKRIIKAIYLIFVFVISLVVIERITNTDVEDMTAEFSGASLPTVSFVLGARQINTQAGFVREMDIPMMRGDILPMDRSRRITAVIHSYDGRIQSPRYEVRPVSGDNLIESTQITEMTGRGSERRFTIQLKDLIETGREYMLVIIMEAGSPQRTVRYYCRIVQTEPDDAYHAGQHIAFAEGFSDAAAAKDEEWGISKYLESNQYGDEDGFLHVNIHSSYKLVTWGDLEIKERTNPEISLKDIHQETASIAIRYRICLTAQGGERQRWYDVEEAYRIRYSEERMYLLDFKRDMQYVFDAEMSDITGNVIDLSVSDPSLEFMESADGRVFAFVNSGRLFMYNSMNNRLVRLFGFWDGDNDDDRTRSNRHLIRILRVDEAGGAVFSVAGYMSRGEHEGEVGIAVYSYQATFNTIEEQVFIPAYEAPELVLSNFTKLSFLSASDDFYLISGTGIYSIQLGEMISKQIVNGMLGQARQGDTTGKRYQISASEATVAWQDEDRQKLNVMNLVHGTQTTLEAPAGESVRLMGFMGEDLVYGLVRDEDRRPDQTGSVTDAMYSLLIVDNDGNILENYRPEGFYVTGVVIGSQQLRLHRVVWDGNAGVYRDAKEDQITSTISAKEGANRITTVMTERFGTIVEIIARNDINTDNLLIQTPKLSLYEGNREVTLSGEEPEGLYYVYDISGAAMIFADEAEAVSTAYETPGVVCADDGSYVWFRGNLLRSNQLMALTRTAEAYGREGLKEEDSLELCLELMLQQEGKNADIKDDISRGRAPAEILGDKLDGYRILRLDGCPSDAMLYYINREIPVMVQRSDGGAMLIIGFNERNLVILDPETGFLGKVGKGDSAAMFAENGDRYLTYIPCEGQK